MISVFKILRRGWPVFLAALYGISANAQDRGFSDERATTHFTRVRTYDAIHLKLEPSFDMADGRLVSVATTTLTPINDGFTEIVFDAVDLDVKTVTLIGGGDLAFRNDGENLIIELDRSYSADDTLSVAVHYETYPKKGLYFVRPDDGYPNKPWQVWSQGEMEESRHWFPCWDFPNDRLTSEMIVTTPKGMIAISNGKLVESTQDDAGVTTFHWRENVPHVVYLVSLVVGEFVEVREEWDGIPVTYYVHPSDRKHVERTFSKTPDMMGFFSEKIGVRYPYEKYAQTTIADFMWGGMENISATTMTRNIIHDERAHLDYQSDGIVAHELAHQWWGDLLTTRNWSNIWLNEGFATYFEALYREYDRGHDEFIMRMRANRDRYLDEDSSKYRRPIVTNRFEDPEQMFDRHTYQKGSLVLHMIRSLLGDELWWKAIRLYADRFRGRTVETHDFRSSIEEATGRPLDWFFDQWVFHGGHPEFLVSWEWDKPNGMVKLEVAQTQTVDSVTPLFRTPIDIALSGAFGSKSFRIEIKERAQTFFFTVPSRPDRVEFDPKDHVLKTLKFDKSKKELINQLKNGWTITGRMRAAEWLVEHPDDSHVLQALSSSLSGDQFWGVRAECAKALGMMRAGSEALIAALDDSEVRVRKEAIKALGEFDNDAAVTNALERVFRTELSYQARAEALKSQAKIGAPKAYKNCLDALKQDSYREWIRSAAFEGLVELKEPRGMDLALKWSAYGRPPDARYAAISALGKLAEYDSDRQEEIREHLEKLLDDPDFRARRSVMKALGALGNTKAIKALKRRMNRENHFGTRRAARDAIEEIQRKSAGDSELAEIRKELEKLKETNQTLEDKVKTIESKMSSATDGKEK